MPSTKAIIASNLKKGDVVKDRGETVTITKVEYNLGQTYPSVRFTTSEGKSYSVLPNRKIAVTRTRW